MYGIEGEFFCFVLLLDKVMRKVIKYLGESCEYRIRDETFDEVNWNDLASNLKTFF